MKTAIHPAYHADAKILCACGSEFVAGSTLPEIHVELCSKCHPFYTGKQKLIDSSRRIEKFQEKLSAKSDVVSGKKVKAVKRAAQKAAKKSATQQA